MQAEESALSLSNKLKGVEDDNDAHQQRAETEHRQGVVGYKYK